MKIILSGKKIYEPYKKASVVDPRQYAKNLFIEEIQDPEQFDFRCLFLRQGSK